MVINNINKGLNIISPFGSSSRSTKKHKISDELFFQGKKKCYWCRQKVYRDNYHNDLNHATADHVYSRNDIRRALSQRIVLCCRGCNQERNNIETWTNHLEYNKICFNNFGERFDLKYLTNGNLLINGIYADNYVEFMPLKKLIEICTIR